MNENDLCMPCRTKSGPCMGPVFCKSRTAQKENLNNQSIILTGRTLAGDVMVDNPDTLVQKRLRKLLARRKRNKRR